MKSNIHQSTRKSTSRRFFLRNSSVPVNLEAGQHFLLNSSSEDQIHYQLFKVFRSTPGQSVILMNKNNIPEISETGKEYLFEIKSIDKKSVDLLLLEVNPLITPLRHKLGLALCLPNKPAKLDFILEKATELGVTDIYLIKSDLSQFAHQLRQDRIEKILLEAAEQSEQPIPARLHYFENLDHFIKADLRLTLIALERSAQSVSLLNLVLNEDLNILIGPEGGFSDREVALINQSDLTKINLGGSILKMDTAALLAIGIASLKLQLKSS